MATSNDSALDVLTDVVRERARAEARELTAMLDYCAEEMVRTASVEPPVRRLVERSAIALAIGEATGFSEAQILLRLSVASTVREQTPLVWAAFADGVVDFSRVRDIAHTVDQLQRDESIDRLDRLVVPYAADHTGAELRQWLRRFVQRVEVDLAVERADEERKNRHVSVKHTDDSMAWLNAYLPSHEAAAIEARLRREARRPAAEGDDRTVAQREADLLVAWCNESDATTSAVDANIAVTIGADVLAGFNPGFAESTDGRWAVPVVWVANLARSGNVFWHRIITDPVSGDVLSHEYLGRYSPDILDLALRFRDGVCQAPASGDHCPSAARMAPGRSPGSDGVAEAVRHEPRAPCVQGPRHSALVDPPGQGAATPRRRDLRGPRLRGVRGVGQRAAPLTTKAPPAVEPRDLGSLDDH